MTNEKAISTIENAKNFAYDDVYEEAFNMAINALKQEPRKGHWIPLGNYDFWGNENSYQCSECCDLDTFPDNFCHNCGAKMIGVRKYEKSIRD